MLNVSPAFPRDGSSIFKKKPVSSISPSPALVPNASVPSNIILSISESRSSSKKALPSSNGNVPSNTKLSVRLPEPLSRVMPQVPFVVPKGVSAR